MTSIGGRGHRQTLTRPDGTEISVLHLPLAAAVPGAVVTGRPVLMVHGLGSDAATNWVQAGWERALHRVGRDVVAFDLRGHGHSARPYDEERYRLALMVGDLRFVADSLSGPVSGSEAGSGSGPEASSGSGSRSDASAGAVTLGTSFDAIGYSLGARLLLEFVADDPTPIRRLVLGGTAGQPQLQGIDPDVVAQAALGGPVPDDPETARIARTISALPGNDVRALSALVRGLHADPGTAQRTPGPTVPTLLGVGTDDPLHDLSRRWSTELPAAEFVSIPGRNHVSAVPSAVFRTAAMEFLTRP